LRLKDENADDRVRLYRHPDSRGGDERLVVCADGCGFAADTRDIHGIGIADEATIASTSSVRARRIRKNRLLMAPRDPFVGAGRGRGRSRPASRAGSPMSSHFSFVSSVEAERPESVNVNLSTSGRMDIECGIRATCHGRCGGKKVPKFPFESGTDARPFVIDNAVPSAVAPD
jgi:hypothetical protein